MNILIQFYDDEENKVPMRHLGSRVQNRATAKDIMESIESVLHEYETEWWQILTILMDNCATMRCLRGGVEALAHKKNENMLDISGDIVYMINNVAKTLLRSVDKSVELKIKAGH